MNNSLFQRVFPKRKPIIGMIHLFRGGQRNLIRQALEDLECLQGFVDGVIVENYDWGYADGNWATDVTKNTIAKVTLEVVRHSRIPVGVNVLPNDYAGSFGIALEVGARFIQMDHVTGNFLDCQSVDPEDYLWYRKHHKKIAVLGGIHPKYYELVDPLTPLAESAKTAKELADAVVVTGATTGDPATLEDLETAREALGEHPLIVGSGLSPRNVAAQFAIADGAIVGTAFKRNGVKPGEPIDIDLVKRLMDGVQKTRRSAS